MENSDVGFNGKFEISLKFQQVSEQIVEIKMATEFCTSFTLTKIYGYLFWDEYIPKVWFRLYLGLSDFKLDIFTFEIWHNTKSVI